MCSSHQPTDGADSAPADRMLYLHSGWVMEFYGRRVTLVRPTDGSPAGWVIDDAGNERIAYLTELSFYTPTPAEVADMREQEAAERGITFTFTGLRSGEDGRISDE